jgi:hypothetical protein
MGGGGAVMDSMIREAALPREVWLM